jgi:hypothetical protein
VGGVPPASRLELLGGVVMIVITAFVATFIVSLIHTVCR